jgi:hypothetical protein
MTKLRRIAPLLLCLLPFALPAGAWAANPLLSGYSGPGGGEQAVLGSKLLPPGGGSGGGSGGSGTAAPATGVAGLRAAATATATATGTTSAAAARPGSASKRERHRAKHAAGSHERAAGTTGSGQAAVRSAAPKVTPYPARATGAGGLLSGGDILLIALGAGALVLLALGLRRLSPPREASN